MSQHRLPLSRSLLSCRTARRPLRPSLTSFARLRACSRCTRVGSPRCLTLCTLPRLLSFEVVEKVCRVAVRRANLYLYTLSVSERPNHHRVVEFIPGTSSPVLTSMPNKKVEGKKSKAGLTVFLHWFVRVSLGKEWNRAAYRAIKDSHTPVWVKWSKMVDSEAFADMLHLCFLLCLCLHLFLNVPQRETEDELYPACRSAVEEIYPGDVNKPQQKRPHDDFCIARG